MSAYSQFLHSLRFNNWSLDPVANTVRANRRDPETRQWVREIVARDDTYLRPAAHGGNWRIRLSVEERGRYSGRSNTALVSVNVDYVPADAEVLTDEDGLTKYKPIVHIETLRNTDRNQSRYWGRSGSVMWNLLKFDTDRNKRTLREAALLLVQNPDLVAWLTFVAQHEAKVKEDAATDARIKDREERERPLPVTVSQVDVLTEDGGRVNEWDALTGKLLSKARAVRDADGKSNLPKLLIELDRARDAIVAVLTDSAKSDFAIGKAVVEWKEEGEAV